MLCLRDQYAQISVRVRKEFAFKISVVMIDFVKQTDAR